MALQSVAISVGRVKSCRNPKKEKPILDEQAITLLLDAPPNTKIGMRDRTILILLYDSAARLDEILSLRKADLFLSTGSPCIRVVGKGQKERVIGLTERTSTHLKQYLSVFHTKDTEATEKYAAQVRETYPDIPERVHPHMLRRTRATGLYRDGVDLSIISRFLGHAQLETTRIYATPSVEMMRRAIAKMPMAALDEDPIWDADADAMMAKLCGLR